MRRTPTALKKLTGTLRQDRINPREPRLPSVRTLSPRPGLSLAIRRELDRLVQLVGAMRILTAVDVCALEMIAAATCEYWQAARVVARRGPTYKCVTQAGAVMYRGRPEVSIAADAWRRVLHGYEQYGLTAASRAKVDADPPTAAASKWAGLLPGVGDDEFLAQRTAAGKTGRDPARFFRDGGGT